MPDSEPPKPTPRKRLFMKQANLVRMFYALAPVVVAGVYLCGWRVLALLAACTAVGVIVGILFGKEVFGGFGRSFANPAIVGHAFVCVCFPAEMTAAFPPALWRWPGALTRWSVAGMDTLPAWLDPSGSFKAVDAISAATPMWARREFGFETHGADLFVGSIGRTFQVAGTGLSVFVTAMSIHIIAEHGYYQGLGSRYRLELEALDRIPPARDPGGD